MQFVNYFVGSSGLLSGAAFKSCGQFHVENNVADKVSTVKYPYGLQSYRTCRERSGIIVRRPEALGKLDFFTHIGRY